MTEFDKTYAIVGGGPRGLFALESLCVALYNSGSTAQFNVTLFEPSDYPGAGWVWNPEQVHTNWLNISERALQNLQGRPEIQIGETIIPSFPSYASWLPEKPENLSDTLPDQYPPRAKMGTYLNGRFLSISNILEALGMLKIITSEVKDLTYKAPCFTLHTVTQDYKNFEEVVLCIGHQDTQLSDQLTSWKEYTQDKPNHLLFPEAYPVSNITDASLPKHSRVAFRGFGLATIDQLRALTILKGGRFETIDATTKSQRYIPSNSQPLEFIPFSLDGLPTVPKPFDAKIDQWFTPEDETLHAFAKALTKSTQDQKPVSNHYFYTEAIADVVVPIFQNLEQRAYSHDLSTEELYCLVINYIHDKTISHELLLSQETPVLKMMELQVGMATGAEKISLDYCIGQVWRHCQPTMYKAFSYAALDDEVMASIIALDEASKRYSYGPPVESIQQLIALAKEGSLNLSYTRDPDIQTTNDGWKLTKNGSSITVNTMINAVLDAPQLVAVDTPLIKNLLQDRIIQPKHTDLGIETNDNAYVQVPDGKSFVPLAVLGRLSKGSVMGVDAILECFGERTQKWANRSIERMHENISL